MGLPAPIFSPFIPTPNLFGISVVSGLSGGRSDGQHLPLPQRLEDFGVSHLHVLPVERSTPWVSPLRVFSPFILTPNLFGISRVNGLRVRRSDGQHLPLLRRMGGSGEGYRVWGSWLSRALCGSSLKGFLPIYSHPKPIWDLQGQWVEWRSS